MNAFFMMGLPAAGKSTVAVEKFAGQSLVMLDADEIKKEHPNYNPREAFLVHDWSTDMLEMRWLDAVAEGASFVMDGTGTNSESMVRRMTIAKANGFTVTLVYVTCSLTTSLRRAALRERQVPESVITEKARNIQTSFEIVREFADVVEVIENDVDVASLIPTVTY